VKNKRNKKDLYLPDQKTEFAASILNKQFRFSDWLAERVIKTVAFLSITIVILIFVFVFRETLPIFQAQKQPVNANGTGEVPSSSAMQPETYSSGESNSVKDLKPESYGNAPASLSHLTAEDTARMAISAENLNSGKSTENSRAISTFLSKDWQPVSDNPRYGLLPLFFGTLKVTLIAILFAAPIAILAALYTAMFAPARIREYIKPTIELLAGFPSVVIGFFALMILASFFQNLFGYSGRLNAFVGGVAMALAAIPVIYTLTEDALTAVPRTFTEASLGLGASIRQTAFQVILPAATPGIFAAVLLGIGRVFGETMIALMATGNAALISVNPFDSVRTLSATIGAEMAEVVFGDTHYSVLFLIGSLLFIFTFTLNALAEFYFRNRIIRRFQGKQS
jgi:phosphate transport system permease protein